jgi:16S rRNA (cytosine967-C5)-methyltransferase
VRRHPDIRWRRQEADLAGYAERQRAILTHASACVIPGGALVYAVCSPEPEEGEDVARALGWAIDARFCNAPALDGGDVFQAYRLRAPT